MNADQHYLVALVHAWAAGETAPLPLPPHVSVRSVCASLAAHNVEPLLAPLLPPEMQSAALAERVAQSRARTDFLLLEYERLLPVLQDRDCDPVLLKGGALALQAYRQPSDRWFLDLDILVPRAQVDQVCARLAEAGYRHLEGLRDPLFYDKYHLHRIMLGPQGSVVEVHWDLTLPGSVYRHDVDGVFTRATSAVLGRHRIKCAAVVDQILHGTYQNIADGFVDLRRVLDLVLLTRGLSDSGWAHLVAEAQRTGMSRALHLSLHNMKLVAGESVPEGVMAAMDPGSALRRTLSGLRVATGCLARRAEQVEDYVPMLHFLLTPTPRLRLREIIRSLWVGEAMLMDKGHRPGRLPGFGRRTLIAMYQIKTLCLVSWRVTRAMVSG